MLTRISIPTRNGEEIRDRSKEMNWLPHFRHAPCLDPLKKFKIRECVHLSKELHMEFLPPPFAIVSLLFRLNSIRRITLCKSRN